MKKLMILMAAVATSAFALGADALKNVFDATTASNLSSWGVPEGEGKAVLADKVLTLATGSDAASYWVKDANNPYAMGDNLYFDVSLDLLGQALDEVPTLPSDAKLALFLLDTTEIDGAPAGTNLYALAKHPTDAETVLMELRADVEALTETGEDAFTRLTVQTYKNVFKSGETPNSAFVVYQNGGETEGATSPVPLNRYYTFKDDGSVNWKSPKSVDGAYLSGVLDATVSGKRTCLLLSVKSAVDGQSFTALDFMGNAKIQKVEINDSGFDFIAADVKVTTITLEGVSITVDPASAYDAAKGTLSASCKITVTKNPGMEILTYTPMGSDYLVDNEDGTFTYTYAEGNDVSFTAVAACATVNGTAYETIEDVLAALGELTSAGQPGTLKLSRDIGASDLADGFLSLSGTVTLDLAGKKIVAPADTVDRNGTVSCSDGNLTILDSATGGCIESDGEGGVAVCSLENSKISIQSGIFKGQIRDAILEAADEDAQGSEEEPVEGETTTEEGASEESAASITITGGSFSVEPDERLIAEGYAATQGEDGYWTVAQGEAPAEVSFTLTISDGAKVSAAIEIGGESVETAPKTLKKGRSYKVTFTAVDGYQFAEGAQTVFEGTAEAAAIVIEAPTVTAIAYTITYSWVGVEVADEEKIKNTNPETYTIENAITFTAPTCEGYTFKGFDIQGIALGETGNKTVTGTFEKASEPAEPVAPGETTYDTPEKAAEVAAAFNENKANLIKAPEGVEDKAAYAALFEATANGSTVTVDLTAKAKADIQTQVDADLKEVDVAGIAAAETGETELSITAEPGLFYSVEQGKTLGEMVEGLRQKVNTKGEVLKLKATKYLGSGFYKILVNTSDK